MKYQVNAKEKLYLSLLFFVNLLFYFCLVYFAKAYNKGSFTTLITYIITIALYFWFEFMMLAGYLRGNAIQVNEHQFPEAYALLKKHAESLQLKEVPEMHVLHGHGIINAFAARLARRNYVVLFADVLDLAYHEGEHELSFIIGHELGHIKQNHVGLIKVLMTWPAQWVPLLGSAYSRACEYTCDAIGAALSPDGAIKGTLILAVGKHLYKKVDIHQAIADFDAHNGFSVWLAEIFASHPPLLKRIKAFLNK